MKRTLPLLAWALCACSLSFIVGCGGGSNPIVVAFPAGTAPMLDAGQSQNFTIMVAHDKNNQGVTWSLASAGTLSNITTTSVTYNAPAGPLTASVTDHLTATSVADKSKSVTVAIVITSPPAISTTSLPAGVEGTAYNQTVAVTGGAGTLTYSISAGALPAGLSLNGSTGAITGTPTGPNGPANFTVKVTDSSTGTTGPQSATKALSITVNLPTPPSITTASLPAATQGAAYNQTVAATSGLTPYTFTISTGSLPQGLSMDSSGHITGMPTGSLGTSSFTVKVTDSSNPTQSATKNLSIKVDPAPVVITTTSLPNGVVNAMYSATLQATGGAPPITWSWVAQAGSTLPPGLVLAPATGGISGTPTSAGTFNVTVTATDSSTPALTASKNLSVTIIPQLVITTTSPLPNGITNTAYTGVTLASTGGSGAVVWTLTGGTTLPSNLALNASTGAITGTPTTAGTFNFTVQAADSGTPQQKVTKSFTISVVQQLVITTNSLPSGAINSTYSATLASSGGTPAVTWAVTVGSLPPGLTLNAATGAITGTPGGPGGMSNFTVQATDSGTPPQTATKALTININPLLRITTTSLPSGTVGTMYNQQLQTNGGGIPPISWTVILGSLPPGLTLTSGGLISGTPTTATGSPFNFDVRAADSGTPTQTDSVALSISIATAPLSVATTSLPNAIVGQAYNQTLASAGGNPPVTWTISVGSLPSWATLTASTGAISGTPTAGATGTTTFTVKATDSTVPTAQTAIKQLSITVVSALSITTTSLPNGAVGTAYPNTTVSVTGGTTPYTWSWAAQAGSSLPPGLSIDSSTGTISGTPSTNTGSPFNVKVSVVDSGSPQQNVSANFSITITVATLLVTTTSSNLPAGTVNTAYPSTQLNASGGIPPYSWSQTAGTLPPGLTLNSSGQITGTPTTATGSPFSFDVLVTDSAVPPHTAGATLSITVSAASACTSGGSESLLSGGYAILLKGLDGSANPVLVGGVLTFNGTANNGLITAGTIDINQNSGFTSNAVTSGSYGVGTDHRGCMVITAGGVTLNFRFSLGNISGTPAVASTVHVIGFDTTGPFTAGIMRKQSGSFSNATAHGTFAFGGSSIQNSAVCNNSVPPVCGGKFAIAGVITFDGNGGITSGEEDINQNGVLDGNPANTPWPASPISFNSATSSYNIASNGRGSETVGVLGTSVVFHSMIYAVSSSEALFMTSDSQTTTNISAGEALLQTGAGTFTGTSVSGTYVGYSTALGSTAGTTATDLYLLSVANPNITGTDTRNDDGTFGSASIHSPTTYTVSASGRMVTAGGGHPALLYIVNSSEAFFLGSNGRVDSGFFQSQTGGPFTNSSANGTYAFGKIDPEDASLSDSSGVATFTPATTSINITQDQNSNGSLTIGGMQSFTYSIDSTGLVHIPSGCTISASSTTCQTLVLIISPTKAAVMDTGSSSPAITIADQ